jgi:RNA polymerase sigma-70 factor (ECF subfamily)
MDMPLDAMSDIPDEALLVRFANGDPAAARALTLRLTPRVMAHAFRLTGNRAEAEDVAQEAMMRLWRVSSEWRQGEARVTTWLYRVVANLCIDRARRAPMAALDDVPEPVDGSVGAPDAMQADARVAALNAALAQLPERQRQAVVLRHLDGLNNPEIAEVMEIGVEAVESLTARGKRALVALLKDQRSALGFTDDD